MQVETDEHFDAAVRNRDTVEVEGEWRPWSDQAPAATELDNDLLSSERGSDPPGLYPVDYIRHRAAAAKLVIDCESSAGSDKVGKASSGSIDSRVGDFPIVVADVVDSLRTGRRAEAVGLYEHWDKRHANRLAVSTGHPPSGTTSAADHPFLGGENNAPRQSMDAETHVRNLKHRFVIVLGVVLFVVLVAGGIGVGVGIQLQKTRSELSSPTLPPSVRPSRARIDFRGSCLFGVYLTYSLFPMTTDYLQ